MYNTTFAEAGTRRPVTPNTRPIQQPAAGMQSLDRGGAQGAAVAWLRTEHNEAAEAAVHSERNDCAHCASRRFCMPDDVETGGAAGIKGVFGNYRKVKQGEAIFRAGEAFRNLYVVKSGSYKTVAIDNEGREQIIGFQIAGEFMGLDGISTGQHVLDAIALEDSVVCCLPFNDLVAAGDRSLSMRNHLHRLMSRELVRESAMLMLIGRMTALERLVAFLLNLSKRYALRGYSSQEFNLRMTRDEIGCHLGLTLETVSRSLSKLSSLGLIKCTGKQVSIKDIAGLERMAGHSIPQ